VEIRFVGRDPSFSSLRHPSPEEVFSALSGSSETSVDVAWVRQIHSAQVLDAAPGCRGEGDALVTDRQGLALAVVTADCVPILLASREVGGGIAAVHAGWRGISKQIVVGALTRLRARPASVLAWIGPAIGPCCYEVGPEVVQAVARACGVGRTEELVRPNPDPTRSNPHLDLVWAVETQLRAAGVEDIRRLGGCTRCHPRELWSYRRDGSAAGRNLAYVWIPALRASTPRGSRANARS